MIPDFQSIMLPMLKLMADGKERHSKEMIDELAKYFKLTDNERKEKLTSGYQLVFDNRVSWAKTYLNKVGLLESNKRAYYIISKRGLDEINKHPKEININFLKQFPEFKEFHKPKKVKEGKPPIDEIIEIPPDELISNTYHELRKKLAEELLDKIMEQPPSFFEKLVVELIVKMGYGGSLQDAGEAIGKSGDEGIDGTIKEDKLGLDAIYIQAKKWKPGNVVGRPEIQKFIGALSGQAANKGIFITTSNFTKEAVDYAHKIQHKISLINGEQLAEYMIDYNLGVSTVTSYEIKRIDNDYFDE